MFKRFSWIIAIIVLSLTAVTLVAQVMPGTAMAVRTEQDLFIVRVGWKDREQLNHLVSTYDVWQVIPAEKTALIAADSAMIAFLKDNGWRVTADPVQTAFHLGVLQERSAETFLGGYKNNAEILAELQSLNAQFPNLTELVDYGDSLCKTEAGCMTPVGDVLPGHDLLALRISNEAITGSSQISGSTVISGSKSVFMLHAGIHSRELAAPETALRFARWLLENYDDTANANPLINPIIDWQESWIIPIANPDGYDVVFLGTQPPYNATPLLHRKNSRGAATSGCFWPSGSSNHFGVDLNRNHSFGWGPIGTSLSPCSPIYRGASGGSEPETAAFETLLSSLIPDQRGPNRTDAAPDNATGLLITMHSFGEVVIWSWGDGVFPDNIAPNHTELKAIGDRFALSTGYTSLQGNDFGGVSGATDDHAYGSLGIPALTFEVGTTFLQSYDYTSNTIWNENRPTLLYAASIARSPYQLVKGPEISDISYTLSASSIMIYGTVSDENNGDDSIMTVSAQITASVSSTSDFASIMAGSVYTATAADSAFDSPIEQFTIGPIPLNGLEITEEGRMPEGVLAYIYLQGHDQSGQDGPLNSIIISSTPVENLLFKYYSPFISKS
ncbi:MAG: carboxypeptidase T [Candidatus Promineifilaceae bacterium]|jgi:carboxypeptidase T